MNDDVRFERLFADGLHESAPGRAPDRLRTKVKAETGETRPRARWLALIKEPPMRTNSRLAVGSPTARVAAILVATLLAAGMIAGAGIAGAQLSAADGPIVVDQSGGGTVETITEALAMAEDGDEILVKPGTYAEAIGIEKDITLHGDGPADEIIIELADAVLIQLIESDAEVANLTLRGDESTQGMEIEGGAPVISGLVFDGTGQPYGGGSSPGAAGSLTIMGGAVRALGNQFLGGGEIMVTGDADAVLEDNELSDGPHLYLENPGDEAVVRGNTISGTFDRAMGLFGPSTMTIEGNTIEDAGGDGITVGWQSGSGHDPLIRDNEISGSRTGVMIAQGAAPVVSDNRIHDNGTGIQAFNTGVVLRDNELMDNQAAVSVTGDDALVEGNTIGGGGTGIVVAGESPLLKDNVVRGVEGRAIAIGQNSSPALSGNTSCDNGTNLFVGDEATPDIDDSNEICEDTSAE